MRAIVYPEELPVRCAASCGARGLPGRPAGGGMCTLGAACAEVAVLLAVMPTDAIVVLIPLAVLALFHR